MIVFIKKYCMNNNNNNKNSSYQMKEMIKRMRGKYYDLQQIDESNKIFNISDMLKITRKLNETFDNKNMLPNKKTAFDQKNEEDKLKNVFSDMLVNIKFIDLEVYSNLIFWGGTINGIIQFIYKVTPNENTSGIEFNYLDEFTPDDPENIEIIKRIESYFDTFYKYWRNNMLTN